MGRSLADAAFLLFDFRGEAAAVKLEVDEIHFIASHICAQRILCGLKRSLQLWFKNNPIWKGKPRKT